MTFKLGLLFEIIVSVNHPLSQIATFVVITAESVGTADDVFGGGWSLIPKGLRIARDAGYRPDAF